MQNQYILSPFYLDEPLPGLELIAESGWLMNKPVLPEDDKQHRMSHIYKQLAEYTTEVVLSGKRPVSITGDCCSSLGVFAGLQKAGIDPIFIWFDAHGDFNTWETTPSGFLGGMPLAMIAGRGEQTIPNAIGLKTVAEEKIILTDGRDLDPDEEKMIKESQLIHLSDVNELNGHPMIGHPLYIHIDMDIINPDEVPAMNYPAAGGPSIAELSRIFRRLSETGKVIGVSVSTWNPELDKKGQNRKQCMNLLKALL